MSIPFEKCVVCGSSEFVTLYPVTDTNQGVTGKWELIACNDCGTAFISPFPSQTEIDSFYRDVFYTNDGKRFRGWMEVLRSYAAKNRGNLLNQFLPNRGRLLDFGSGAGHFAAAQSANGWYVHALDPYSKASDHSSEISITDQGFKLLYPDNYFDAVTLWFVIEHLRNPESAIKEFYRVLKPGGILLLAQQDFGSIQAKFFKENWLYLDIPRHLWQFTSASLTLLSETAGFNLKKVSWSCLEMSPYCMLQSTLNKLLGNHNDLFLFLKNRNLAHSLKSHGQYLKPRIWALAASVIILPFLAPLVFILYFILLLFKQGDIFTLYLQKNPNKE